MRMAYLDAQSSISVVIKMSTFLQGGNCKQHMVETNTNRDK